MSEDRDDQLRRYAAALDEVIKLGDYLWRNGGHVPARGVARRIRDIARQALPKEIDDDVQ